MEFSEIASKLGVCSYPPELDALYEQRKGFYGPACDLEQIRRLEQEYSVFGKYFDALMAAADAVNRDPDYSSWVRVTARYILDSELGEARVLPLPDASGAEFAPMIPLCMMLPQIEKGILEYAARGFSREELEERISAYQSGISAVERRTGKPGIDKTYFHWLMLFAKARIFKTQGVQFEMRTMLKSVIYLRNRVTKDVIGMMIRGTFHRTGRQHLGAAGYAEYEGAFQPTFREDEDNYYGYPLEKGRISAESKTFSKIEWEIFAKPGDPCFAMHFSKNADISQESLRRAYASAKKLAAERYPEFTGYLVECVSWLMDPTLVDILGEKARISAFANSFIKYPQKSAGREGFSYVFGNFKGPLEELPEDTSLQRGLKKHYLNGGYTYAYAGIWYTGEDHYEGIGNR